MVKKITDIDGYLRAIPLRDGLRFDDIRKTAARVYGLAESKQMFCRIPPRIWGKLGEELLYLQGNTSGGRVRFLLSGKRLGVRLRVTNTDGFPHMAYSGYAGIDCFAGIGRDAVHLGTRWPELGNDLIETEFTLPDGPPSLITIYLPLYDGVASLQLGIEPGAEILPPPTYTYEKPIIFYGSSITQGGCASRASNSYAALACRWLDSDFVNLGFSGNAKGENWMAQHIAGRSMSCFVYDYDHNAPDPAHLRATHLPFLEEILSRQPNVPVIVLSKPNPDLSGPDYERREIIRETCEWARARGTNITFLDGDTLLGTLGRESCTVDGVHPNDLGFWRMAQAVFPILRAQLEKSE